MFLVGGLMLAPQIGLISLYKLLQGLGIYNTYWAMIVPYVAYRIPFTVFLLWSYFLFLPREVEEAAYSDGCNSWGILWHVVLPMSKPIIATAALLSARVIWNEFMFALVFVEDSALRTIPIGLMGLKSQVDTDWTVLLAGLTLSALPIILLFILTQKQFVRGLAEGGVKG
jgi:raffinose/stachyose/melibiose transport system permease protein